MNRQAPGGDAAVHTGRARGLAFAIAVHIARFGVIAGALALAPLLGIQGWYAGLFANMLCAVYAAALMTWLKLWRRTGFLTLWRGPLAACLLLFPLAEALAWAVPGLQDRAPGFVLYGVSLLLVGFNEELVSRGVVLSRLSRSFSPLGAVALTGALFGMQHLSLFATSQRDGVDILTNVLASACYGFGLAAYQYRFHWILPLILIHGLADFTTILSRAPFGDLAVAVISALYLVYGCLILVVARGAIPSGATPTDTTPMSTVRQPHEDLRPDD